MKTLGDTGLIPNRKITQQHDDFDNGFESGENHMIDIVSALPLKQIIEKALDLGLVRISKCENDDCIEGLVLVDSETGCCVSCTECSGIGFTITEGGQK